MSEYNMKTMAKLSEQNARFAEELSQYKGLPTRVYTGLRTLAEELDYASARFAFAAESLAALEQADE
jgi:hypothetical protein